jgi:hypothetical protein
MNMDTWHVGTVYKIKQGTAHIHAISVSETVMELGIGNLHLLPRAVHAHWDTPAITTAT